MPSITALVMVRATLTEMSAPTRSKVAASVTAVLGDSAPVAIEAAMAFPVSWKPLVKSKARAVTTTMTSMTVAVVTRPMIGALWSGPQDESPGCVPHHAARARDQVFVSRSFTLR